jgi:torulene dioxygenase
MLPHHSSPTTFQSRMTQVCDLRTLEPKRMLNHAMIDFELAGFGICAHLPRDRPRGYIHNYLIDSDHGVMYVFALNYQSNPTKLLWKTTLPCRPCYIHSLAMTKHHMVFIRNPIHMDVSDVTRPVLKMLTYEPESPTSFFVLDKNDGRL